MGLSPSDKIPGRAIPFRSNTRTALSFLKSCRNKIPGWGYSLQIKYQGGLSPLDQIPGRCYPLEKNTRMGIPLQIKYQDRTTPFRSNSRAVLSLRNKIPGWGYPLHIEYQCSVILQRQNTVMGLPPSDLIAERGYPLQIKYQGGVIL